MLTRHKLFAENKRLRPDLDGFVRFQAGMLGRQSKIEITHSQVSESDAIFRGYTWLGLRDGIPVASALSYLEFPQIAEPK